MLLESGSYMVLDWTPVICENIQLNVHQRRHTYIVGNPMMCLRQYLHDAPAAVPLPRLRGPKHSLYHAPEFPMDSQKDKWVALPLHDLFKS